MTDPSIYEVGGLHIRSNGSSVETIRDCITGDVKPLLELTDAGAHVLRVAFVRSGAGFTLAALLRIVVRHATTRGYRRVELEDDAFFPTLNGASCAHRALFRRAFDGKTGIYESKGWRPRADTRTLIATLSAYTKAQARELEGLIREAHRFPRSPRSPRFLTNVSMAAFSASDTGSFGAWLNAQSCGVLTHFYNALLVLSADRWRSKIEVRSTVSTATKAFLRALHEFRMANQVLYIDI